MQGKSRALGGGVRNWVVGVPLGVCVCASRRPMLRICFLDEDEIATPWESFRLTHDGFCMMDVR